MVQVGDKLTKGNKDMIKLEKDGEIIEVESTNEYAIAKLKLRGYTIV